MTMPTDNVPTTWDQGCEYCTRYNRPCGRHEDNRPAYFPTKYDSARDEVIALLSDEAEGYGMRDDSTGDVDAPTGYVQLVTIPADVNLSDYTTGIADAVAYAYGVTPADVAGTHVVTHNSQGFVDVTSYDSEEEARAAFDVLADEYAEWDDQDDEPADSCLAPDGHWYVITYGRAPWSIHATNCPTCHPADD